MRCRSPFAAGVGALLALWVTLGACGGTGPPLPPLPPLPPPGAEPETDDLRDALDALDEADRDSFLIARLRGGGLTPAFGGHFRLASGAVVAFVPGRHPARGRELVVAAAPSGPPAAALLEEARLLSARAAFGSAPERTVLVAFLPPRSGPQGLAAVLDAPLWTDSLTVTVLVAGVDEGGPGYEAVAVARGVPIRLLPTPGVAVPKDEVVALALARTVREAVNAAANGAPAAPDAQTSAGEDRE